MAEYISQAEIPTETQRTRKRIDYLDFLRDDLATAIKDYFEKKSDGESVTLFVFKRLGKQKIIDIANKFGKTVDLVKQDIGTAIPIVGSQLYSAKKLFYVSGHEK